MYKLGVAILTIVWILDILNIPCMDFLDTTIPINTLGWFLIWVFIPSTSKGEKCRYCTKENCNGIHVTITKETKCDKDE